MELDQIRQCMKETLYPARYVHSVGVEEVCCDLALIHGYDMEAASIAGILHDNAKCMKGEELVRICEDNNIVITDKEQGNKQLLHGKVGALFAKEKYGIIDEAIIDAIKYHITGRMNMTLLEKIVFVADYIEPNRKPLPNIELIREHAYNDLDLAVYETLKNILDYLQQTENLIDDTSIKTMMYYKSLLNNKDRVK